MKKTLVNIFFVITILFIFVFFSFVSLRWGSSKSINVSIISLDLIRVILIILHVVLSYLGANTLQRYAPMMFNFMAMCLTSYFCPPDRGAEFIGLFHALNISYFFLELSLSFVANKLNEVQAYEAILQHNTSLTQLLEIANEEIRKLKLSGERITQELKEKHEEFMYHSVKHNAILRKINDITPALITNSHDMYILDFDIHKTSFVLREIAKKEQNKPKHLTELLQ